MEKEYFHPHFFACKFVLQLRTCQSKLQLIVSQPLLIGGGTTTTCSVPLFDSHWSA